MLRRISAGVVVLSGFRELLLGAAGWRPRRAPAASTGALWCMVDITDSTDRAIDRRSIRPPRALNGYGDCKPPFALNTLEGIETLEELNNLRMLNWLPSTTFKLPVQFTRG